MGSRLTTLVAGVVMLLVMAGVAIAGGGGRPVSATMTGANEVPGPGDPDASGQADLKLNQGQGRVCFEVSWADIDGTVFAGHIHVAPAGVAGPIVVTLFTGSFSGTDSVSDCVGDVDPDLIKAISKNPSAYYVNVHSAPGFTGGAIRGQLQK